MQTNALFVADWSDALFAHFRADPRMLQPRIPFQLDLRHGSAYLSLVAFTQKRLRFARGGRLARWIAAPLAHHEFLNLRTYVRVKNETGIYFVAEWIPNRLAALIGPPTYGLPYRLGRLRYSASARTVQAKGRALTMRFPRRHERPIECLRHSLDEFLLERYTAWTYMSTVARRFDVEHAPWRQVRADVEMLDVSLLEQEFLCTDWTAPVSANYCECATDVRISAPRAQIKSAELSAIGLPFEKTEVVADFAAAAETHFSA